IGPAGTGSGSLPASARGNAQVAGGRSSSPGLCNTPPPLEKGHRLRGNGASSLPVVATRTRRGNRASLPRRRRPPGGAELGQLGPVDLERQTVCSANRLSRNRERLERRAVSIGEAIPLHRGPHPEGAPLQRDLRSGKRPGALGPRPVERAERAALPAVGVEVVRRKPAAKVRRDGWPLVIEEREPMGVPI